MKKVFSEGGCDALCTDRLERVRIEASSSAYMDLVVRHDTALLSCGGADSVRALCVQRQLLLDPNSLCEFVQHSRAKMCRRLAIALFDVQRSVRIAEALTSDSEAFPVLTSISPFNISVPHVCDSILAWCPHLTCAAHSIETKLLSFAARGNTAQLLFSNNTATCAILESAIEVLYLVRLHFHQLLPEERYVHSKASSPNLNLAVNTVAAALSRCLDAALALSRCRSSGGLHFDRITNVELLVEASRINNGNVRRDTKRVLELVQAALGHGDASEIRLHCVAAVSLARIQTSVLVKQKVGAELDTIGTSRAFLECAKEALDKLQRFEGESRIAARIAALRMAELLLLSTEPTSWGTREARDETLARVLQQWQRSFVQSEISDVSVFRLVARTMQYARLHQDAVNVLESAYSFITDQHDRDSVDHELARANAAAANWSNVSRKRSLLSSAEQKWLRVVSRRFMEESDANRNPKSNGAPETMPCSSRSQGASSWESSMQRVARAEAEMLGLGTGLDEDEEDARVDSQRGQRAKDEFGLEGTRKLAWDDPQAWIDVLLEVNTHVSSAATAADAAANERSESGAREMRGDGLKKIALRLSRLAEEGLIGLRLLESDAASVGDRCQLLRPLAREIVQHSLYNAASVAVTVLRNRPGLRTNELFSSIRLFVTERSSGFFVSMLTQKSAHENAGWRQTNLVQSTDENQVERARESLERVCRKMLEDHREM